MDSFGTLNPIASDSLRKLGGPAKSTILLELTSFGSYGTQICGLADRTGYCTASQWNALLTTSKEAKGCNQLTLVSDLVIIWL